MEKISIGLSYMIFAIFATAANIGSQDIALGVYTGPYTVTVSVLVGTAVGLVVKYVLDKKFIFCYQVDSAKQDSKLLILYATTGVATTVIFWGAEFAFDLIFGTKQMRYVGGAIGLAIGYVIKYQLDKRFVFTLEKTK